MHDPFERFLLRLMGWYSERDADMRDRRAEMARQRAIAARVKLERTMNSYRAADGRLRR